MMHASMPRDAHGSSLIVAIVFLLLLSTLALAGLRSSTTNVQIVGNMQARQEAQAAAQMLIERLVSSSEFATNSAGVFATANVETDFNGDTTIDARAVLAVAPACLRARPVPLSELDPTNAAQAPCFASATIANPGISPGAGTPGSLCADTDWQLTARGTDLRSGSAVTITQGTTVRREFVGTDVLCTN